MKSRATGCAFCWENKHGKSEFKGQPHRVLFETEHFWVKYSLFPRTPRHLLAIPKRHIEKATEMNLEEWVDLFHVRQRVEKWYLSEGIKGPWHNTGDNYGKVAGQTRAHYHFHFFDRFEGDVENPRGGIINFKPPIEELGNYEDET